MKKILTLLLIALSVCSCWKFGHQHYIEYFFLTGECLNSPILTLESHKVTADECIVKYKVDWDNFHVSRVSSFQYTMPSDNVFGIFSTNSSKLKRQYKEIIKTANIECPPYQWSTVLYDSGAKVFVEIDGAGKDYSDSIEIDMGESSDFMLEVFGKLSGIPLTYSALVGKNIKLHIPLEVYSKIPKYARYKLSIPVTRVDYISWLNDRLTDPEAPLVSENIDLVGEFVPGYTAWD